MAWDKTPWAPPLVELAGGMAGHLLAWEQHERDGSWWAWVSWVREAGGRRDHKVVLVRANSLRPLEPPEAYKQCRAGCVASMGRSAVDSSKRGWAAGRKIRAAYCQLRDVLQTVATDLALPGMTFVLSRSDCAYGYLVQSLNQVHNMLRVLLSAKEQFIPGHGLHTVDGADSGPDLAYNAICCQSAAWSLSDGGRPVTGSDGQRSSEPAAEVRRDWRPGQYLTRLEREVCRRAAAGELVDVLGDASLEPDEMPQNRWRRRQAIRAEVLRHLLVDKQWRVHNRGVQLHNVVIKGQLNLYGSTLRCPLQLMRCYFDAEEPVVLDYATAPLITFTGCHLPGLKATMLVVQKYLDLSHSMFTGSVILRDATIAGRFQLGGAQLKAKDETGYALRASRIKVGGGVEASDGFVADHAIRMTGAVISGLLSFSGADLRGQDDNGNALRAGRVKVDGPVVLSDGFRACGAVRLRGADIVGDLSCTGAQLMNQQPGGDALTADGITVGGNVFLDGGLVAVRRLSFRSARVGGSLRLRPKYLAAGDGGVALDTTGAHIAGRLYWAPENAVHGTVNLQNTVVGQLEDNWTKASESANGYWPSDGRLSLVGLAYDSICGDYQPSFRQRLGWIRSQYRHSGTDWLGFAAQPYEQLATVYRQAGQDAVARRVAIARRADLRKYGNLNRYRKLGNWLLDKTIKYGYQSWRAGAGLALLYGAVWLLATIAQHNHGIVPVGNIKGLDPMPTATTCTSNYPCFAPAGYAIDIVIPIINVRQAQYWAPNGYAWGYAWVTGIWIATVLGWILATLLVAGLTGLTRRGD